MKSALITGITGQDGAYLCALLLANNYKVYGGFRRSSSANFWRLKYLDVFEDKNLTLVECDICDLTNCIEVIKNHKPDEVYNLAAQSFVGTSFGQPVSTAQITGIGALNVLEAIRLVKSDTRFYQASTSELYGLVQEIPQSETTTFYPRSPYASAKLFAHSSTINYRESYDMFASCGILFNHESPLRGPEFVTRKITQTVALIGAGKASELRLGNLDAKRDWGHANEYVEGMYRILQHDKADTFVLATGVTTSVRDFVKMSFQAIDVELEFKGDGVSEIGIDSKSGKTVVVVDEQFFRPAEVDLLIGDPTKAKMQLGWVAKTSLEKLCTEMVSADMDRVKA